MAGKQETPGSGQSAETGSARTGLAPPSAGEHSALQHTLSCVSLDPGREVGVQPFPRSPKLQRKTGDVPQPSQEQLSRCMEELQAERSKTQAHIRSLKKRKADLSRSSEVMKQQVRERFENMRRVLMQDEQDVLESLELDLRKTRTQLDQVQKNWKQHQDQVAKNISSIQEALSMSTAAEKRGKVFSVSSLSAKKPDASEEEIRLNEERFERLLKTLSFISKQLGAELQRKTLLLDSSPLLIDRQTCHSQIRVTSEGRGLFYTGTAQAAPEHPLRFDGVCCALGRSPLTASRSYWEVDVRCCLAWAVGVAYASLERKGQDKGAKLGRNRNSWCIELRNGRLCAWHNNRHVVCQGIGHAPPCKIGVWVNYDKGQLTFYNADAMAVLQRFSAAVTPVFDRAHHQFTEPLYPAIRFLKPPENQTWPNHLELCHLVAP